MVAAGVATVGPPSLRRFLVDSDRSVDSLPPEAWPRARQAAARLVHPLQRFLAIEAASGIVLIIVAAIALGWANSPWADAYHALWHAPIGLQVGDWAFVRPLHFWINDGLMTVFFFVVGLELRRELYEGDLADVRRAALPFAAALGGMMVPALIYVAFNAGGEGARGWAIPMATDIAFAVGVIAMLGSRVPGGLRVLLLALAVIDDLGAIIVIALFYSGGIDGGGLAIALGGVVAGAVLRRLGVRAIWAYLGPGIAVWIGLYVAGVHPTLAGVILGLSTPVRPWFGAAGFAEVTRENLRELDNSVARDEVLTRLDAIEHARREAVSPVEHLLHQLHPIVAFGVMPVFALANAGVSLGGVSFDGAGLHVFLGVALGLAVGKPLGIALAARVAIAARLAQAPADAPARGILVVGAVGGLGFTMAIFLAQLAFPTGPLLATAKLAVVVGSAVAAFVGLGLGLTLPRAPTPTPPSIVAESARA